MASTTNPIARIERLTNWSLILSALSFIFSIFTAIPALYLAWRARNFASELGTTSSDTKIKVAWIIAIVGVVVNLIIIVSVI